MRAFDYIQHLQAQGSYHVAVGGAQHALDRSTVATRASLRRLKDKGFVASPLRGFIRRFTWGEGFTDALLQICPSLQSCSGSSHRT